MRDDTGPVGIPDHVQVTRAFKEDPDQKTNLSSFPLLFCLGDLPINQDLVGV